MDRLLWVVEPEHNGMGSYVRFGKGPVSDSTTFAKTFGMIFYYREHRVPNPGFVWSKTILYLIAAEAVPGREDLQEAKQDLIVRMLQKEGSNLLESDARHAYELIMAGRRVPCTV